MNALYRRFGTRKWETVIVLKRYEAGMGCGTFYWILRWNELLQDFEECGTPVKDNRVRFA